MECPRCHNQNNAYIYSINGKYYCRKCITFSRVFIDDSLTTKRIQYPKSQVRYSLDFELSKRQLEISHQLVLNYQNGKNSFVWAVCGSGKTEIVFEVIQYALRQGHRVCFCIPRKELVKELYQRIRACFHDITIGLLYGGCVENSDAQFVICTMHQLYRFENQFGFDLMIADEVDAFPFYKNDVLESIFQNCCLKAFIKLSATFSHEDITDGQLFIMNKRYHGVPLPIPRSLICPLLFQKWIILLLILRYKKRWIVYVPTIHHVDKLVHFFQKFFNFVEGVSSKTPNTQEIIERLKNNDHYIIVSTTLLERGVTVDDVQVIVYQGEHPIFDERTLIQIAGRVGRKPEHPTGVIYILMSYQSKEVHRCIKTIKKLNQYSV